MGQMTAAEKVERFRKDALYVNEHWEELMARYPDCWVALYELKVVADAKTPVQLRTKLLKKGIEPGTTYWHHLATEEDLLIVLAR